MKRPFTDKPLPYEVPEAEMLEVNFATLLCDSLVDSSLEDIDLTGPEI